MAGGHNTKLTVLREDFLTKGEVKVFLLTARLKARAKTRKMPATLAFVSHGLLQDNVDLLIRRGDACRG